jgi:2-hydroxy-6-oxonona-2,4-dienedioate hydrolase
MRAGRVDLTNIPLHRRSLWTALVGCPFSQAWIDANGVRTRFLHTGSAGKPAIVLLHGVIGSAEAFIYNIGPYGKHFDCYAIDLLGNGYTDKPDYDYHIPLVAKHVCDFMDSVGLERASILGTSYGSRVAARFAVNYPDRVDKLILVSPGGLRFVPEDSAKIRASSLKAIEDLSWDSNRGRLEGLMRDPAAVSEDMVVCRLAIYGQRDFQDAKYHNLVAHTPEAGHLSLISEDEYRGIKARSLVIRGVKDDGKDLRGAGKIAELIPGARYHVMTNVGHWPYYEHPDEFNKVTIDFLLEN